MRQDFSEEELRRIRKLIEAEPVLSDVAIATKAARMLVIAVAGIIAIFGFDHIATFVKAHIK